MYLRTFIIVVALFFTTTVTGQDSIVAENIFSHEIRDGSRTAMKHIIGQNTYNKAGKKVLQIQYFDSIANIKTYTLFFYQDNQLVSKETFTGEKSLISIERFSYTDMSKIKESKLYEPLDDQMQNTITTRCFYTDTALSKKIVFGRNGKRIRQISYEYKPEQLTEITLYKKGGQEENLKSVKVISVFSENRITSKSIDNLSFEKTRGHYSVEYSYNIETGKLISEIWYDEKPELIKTIRYRWDIDGTLRDRGLVDGAGNYIEFISYKRENYVVNLGNQQMFDLSNPVTR